jgi:hypothetical protein
MREQLLFRFAGTIDKGDQAPNPNAAIWVVEYEVAAGVWYRLGLSCPTRQRARQIAKAHRASGKNTRVVPYKACIDSKGRHNRQITSERLDA